MADEDGDMPANGSINAMMNQVNALSQNAPHSYRQEVPNGLLDINAPPHLAAQSYEILPQVGNMDPMGMMAAQQPLNMANMLNNNQVANGLDMNMAAANPVNNHSAAFWNQ